jgi:hypothetical protein
MEMSQAPGKECWIGTVGLKFIKMKDGRHLLHQAWRSITTGKTEWRPVPLEEEA